MTIAPRVPLPITPVVETVEQPVSLDFSLYPGGRE